MNPIRVCFVCLGNICRSPTAEAVFLELIEREGLRDRFEVDSAGTGDWHVGERAHGDTRAAARERGVEVASIARQFVSRDFARFDYVIAMDHPNLEALERIADTASSAKIHLFRDFDPESPKGSDVPDPYFSGGFGGVYEICEAAASGLLAELKTTHGL